MRAPITDAIGLLADVAAILDRIPDRVANTLEIPEATGLLKLALSTLREQKKEAA
jgi:hypothetical protein